MFPSLAPFSGTNFCLFQLVFVGVGLVFSLGSQCKTIVLVSATTSQGVLVSPVESVTPCLHTLSLSRMFLESSSPTTRMVV